MDLWTLFSIAQNRFPNKTAITFTPPALGDTSDGVQQTNENNLTFRQLYQRVDAWAASLQEMGVQRGDRVALYLGNRPEFALAYLSIIRLGAIMVPVNLRYRRLEIGHILSDAEPKLLITEDAQQPILDDISFADFSSVQHVLSVDQPQRWQSAETLNPAAVHGDDLAMIMYTSGTTGRSKGAMISHNNVLATVTGLLAAWSWSPEDVILLPLPLFHTHGLVVGLHCALAAGATTLLRRSFDAAETLSILQSGGATLFFGVPTLYVRLLEQIEQMAAPPDLGHMRLFCSGSAPLPAEIHAAFEQMTGQRILERYGMTETGMNFSNPYAGPRRAGTVGTPLPGVSARIVDESGRDVQPGAEGELLVRGSNVFRGYWRNPEKSAESFSKDEQGFQWFHTGDLATQDPETGYVTLLGRSHELIISGGFNIYPREIEELLETYPGVREAAVVGAPSDQWGEVPLAWLVVDQQPDEEMLIDWCKEQLAGFKVPRTFRYVKVLPRNAMGKLQKHLLGDDRNIPAERSDTTDSP